MDSNKAGNHPGGTGREGHSPLALRAPLSPGTAWLGSQAGRDVENAKWIALSRWPGQGLLEVSPHTMGAGPGKGPHTIPPSLPKALSQGTRLRSKIVKGQKTLDQNYLAVTHVSTQQMCPCLPGSTPCGMLRPHASQNSEGDMEKTQDP